MARLDNKIAIVRDSARAIWRVSVFLGSSDY